MIVNLGRYKEPEVYKRAGKECYYDKISKQLRPKNPEEKIRLQFVEFMHRKMLVPYEAMQIEVPLFKKGKNLGKKVKGRIDIAITGAAEVNDRRVVLVVECKAKTVVLTDDVLDQVSSYAKEVDAPFICMTNGSELDFYFYNKTTQCYEEVPSVPTYRQLCSKEKIETLPYENFVYKRQYGAFSEKKLKKNLIDDGILGRDTDKGYYPLVMHLNDCLMDDGEPARQCSAKEYRIKDKGVRFTTFGNASGGKFPGHYRCFLVQDNNDNAQIVSFALSSYIGNGKNKKIVTSLNVAIDNFEKHHHSLQLVLDKYVSLKDNRAYFYHDGRMANGNRGTVKNQLVLEYVRQKASFLVDESENKVYLGSIPINRELFITDADVKELLCNLVIYALLRDDVRNIVTKNSSSISQK